MRKIAVVTVARSDYGLYRPILRELERRPELELQLVVGGMHLSERHGSTVEEIERDGWPIAARAAVPDDSDEPAGIAASIGASVAAFGRAYDVLRPNLLLLLGDRYEMLAAAVASLPFALPVAHVHGGESTEGLIDEAIRHAVTKMSHVHLAATEAYARRIIQLGEEPWRVHAVGAPGIDAIRETEPLGDTELDRLVGLAVGERTLLVTYHPVTLEPEHVEARVSALLEALAATDFDLVFTAPNADTHNGAVTRLIEQFVGERPGRVFARSLGSRGYLSLLRRARAMVGNSSSGIIEAMSFELPVVNVGMRQQGRLRALNVVDVGDDAAAIVAGIREATSDGFRAGLVGAENPYGDGHAAARIVDVLAALPLDERLLVKRFHDLPEAG
jgi:UDP-hydrolysing UDP-N-acetyl-D-glucosamine 2-epimerase